MIDIIKNKLKAAMIAKDKRRVDTLRNILSKLKMKEIKLKRQLTDDESLKVLQTMSKQIKDSIEQFMEGGRDDLVANEKEELEILNEFLPKPMNEEEIIIIIDKVIEETGATDIKDMGKVMGAVVIIVAGRADGKIISRIVREKLS